MDTNYQLQWLDFSQQYSYSFNLSGIRLSFKGPNTDMHSDGFDISTSTFKNAIATSEGGHGPMRLARISWSCEVEDGAAIHQQGVVIAQVMLFHSEEFSARDDKLVHSDEDLQLSILDFGVRCQDDYGSDNYLIPYSTSDLTPHLINNRTWFEFTTGVIEGSIDYDLFTRLSNELTLGIYFHPTGFWPNTALPHPDHKAIVFESILDFLAHIDIVEAGSASTKEIPPLGVHAPFKIEKNLQDSDARDPISPTPSPEEGW